jgi:hypothetical protein
MWMYPLPATAQAVPDGVLEEGNRLFAQWQTAARENRNDFLEMRSMNDKEIDITRAVLQSPYLLCRMGHREFIEFGKNPERNIVSFSKPHCWMLPITVEGRVVGALAVGENNTRDGERALPEAGDFVSYGGNLADNNCDRRIIELRREYTEREGYTMVCLNVHPVGGFIVIQREDASELLTPYTLLGGNVLSLEEGTIRGSYPVLRMDEALPMLVAEARKLAVKMESYDTPLPR